MIEKYFESVEEIIKTSLNVFSYTLSHKIYSYNQGLIKGKIEFENGNRLEFSKLLNTDSKSKKKYRYHFIDSKSELIFRYDNSKHHFNLNSFPHHKHLGSKVISSQEPTLEEILKEITNG